MLLEISVIIELITIGLIKKKMFSKSFIKKSYWQPEFVHFPCPLQPLGHIPIYTESKRNKYQEM